MPPRSHVQTQLSSLSHREHRSRKIEEQDRILTAYHEAGHATIQALLEDADPLHKVTIIPRGPMGGATFSLPEKDRYGYGRKYLDATLRVLCGGRVAEQKKTGETSSGAAMDIKMLTRYARSMVLDWGMSKRLGFINYSGDESRESLMQDKEHSDETARIIDEEVKTIADDAYSDTERLVEANWDKVVAIAEALLRYETLQKEDIDRIMRGELLEKPTVADLLSAESSSDTDDEKPAGKPAAGEEPDAGLGGMMPHPA